MLGLFKLHILFFPVLVHCTFLNSQKFANSLDSRWKIPINIIPTCTNHNTKHASSQAIVLAIHIFPGLCGAFNIIAEILNYLGLKGFASHNYSVLVCVYKHRCLVTCRTPGINSTWGQFSLLCLTVCQCREFSSMSGNSINFQLLLCVFLQVLCCTVCFGTKKILKPLNACVEVTFSYKLLM